MIGKGDIRQRDASSGTTAAEGDDAFRIVVRRYGGSGKSVLRECRPQSSWLASRVDARVRGDDE
jgi:hypothetical protein